MIEGKLGHHFQVDEMRHIAGPACPAFTGCRSAKRRCCSCTARPTCPAFTAHQSTFLLKLLSARTRSSACPVYERFAKELALIWQHLFQLISAARWHCWVRCWAQTDHTRSAAAANSHHPSESPPPKREQSGTEGKLGWRQPHTLPSHCPTFHKWQTMHNAPILKWSGGHSSQLTSQIIQQVSGAVRHALQVQRFGKIFLKCANSHWHRWAHAADRQQPHACLQSSL